MKSTPEHLRVINARALPEGAEEILARVLSACASCEGVNVPCAVDLTITDDEGIREINRDYRDTDKATDVLSFPSVSYPRGKTARACETRLKNEYDPERSACLLGDIVISIERALAQAEEYGHSPLREITYLFAHGIFHLFGYDHMEEGEKRLMRSMEEAALKTAGEVSDKELLALSRSAIEGAYAPYSHYKVGAALLCGDGRVFTGCNIENASYGLTNCAERTAVFKAVSAGARDFRAIFISADKSLPWPCGACRQVLNEFAAPGMRVIVSCGEKTAEKPLSLLLPEGFGPASGTLEYLGKESKDE